MILRDKRVVAIIALLTVLSLNACMSTNLVDAAATKEPTLFISGSGSVVMAWKSGKSQTYFSTAYVSFAGLEKVTFIPNHGWNINACLVDGYPQTILDEDGFSLINVRIKNMISVTFKENGGIDDVDLGSNVGAYPDPYVGLIFDIVLAEGFAYANTIESAYALPPDAKAVSWNILTDAVFENTVVVILVLNLSDLGGYDPQALRLLRTEDELARADLNFDGKVDGADVSIVANANPSKVGDPNYDPRLDMNFDDSIDDLDVNIVNNYNGALVWEDITLQVVVDSDKGYVYVYGVTDHFSIFSVH